MKTGSLRPAAWQACSISIILAAELVSSVPAKSRLLAGRCSYVTSPCEPHTEAAIIRTWNTTALQLMVGELALMAVLSDVSVLVGYRLRPGLVLHTHARQPSWIFNKKVKNFNNCQTVKKFLIKVFNKNLVKISLKF